MGNNHPDKLGYHEWAQHAKPEGIREGFAPARVIEVNKNRYVVSDGECDMRAELSGKFLFDAVAAVDFPTVGDWVQIQVLDGGHLAIIHAILPRKTLLKRKEPGKRIEFQLIAANIDIGLIVQSTENYSFNLLDRYLVMLNESHIQPVIVFNKIDLLSPVELARFKEEINGLKQSTCLVSNVSDNGLTSLTEKILPGKTYCLLGQSGVGKTSLLNRLLGSEKLDVGEVREKDGKGRHTTVRRQLICLDSGSIFIDTPGMRELGNFDIGSGMAQTFDGLSSHAKQCRFRDCTHTHEEGCAVLAAVQNNEIDKDRYDNFIKLKKESDYYDMSYQEKRKKDKSFGKHIKNYKKLKKHR